jgi:uncharacterized protein
MKFLCDHMLSRLGKWLRAAGHDTFIITTSISDREVLSIAIATDRFLITRDRHFLNMKASHGRLLYLKSNGFDDCIQELSQKIDIDWLYDPFTRCLMCNALLEYPSIELIKQAPLSVRQHERQFWHCPFCHQLYWEGSHTQRMRQQLEIWQKGDFS